MRQRFNPEHDFPVSEGQPHDVTVLLQTGVPRRPRSRKALTVFLGIIGALFGISLGILGGFMITHEGKLDGFMDQFSSPVIEMMHPAAKLHANGNRNAEAANGIPETDAADAGSAK